jgi:hypothetical protein
VGILPPGKKAHVGEAQASPETKVQDMLESFLARAPIFDLARERAGSVAPGSQALVHAPELLQDEADYRGTLQRWFELVTVGGWLVITVPHAFLDARQDRLPAPRRPRQRRLYTPASLLAEVEESLPANSYRLRWAADRDHGYDYALGRVTPPVGQHDIALVIERIAPPDWDLAPPDRRAVPPPEVGFEPLRTRVETMAVSKVERILLLKLDHLGDFVMAVPALQAVRRNFPNAHITLVVSEWNAGLARRVGVADEVLIFEAYPRDAADLPVDMAGRSAALAALVGPGFDLAIDLRSFPDTRILLRDVDAAHKAGLGHRGDHPFLDIFLPIDPAGERADHAWVNEIPLAEFVGGDSCRRGRFSMACDGIEAREHAQTLVWGPYRMIGPGNYLFQPFLDANFDQAGLLAYDIAIDTHRSVYGVFDGTTDIAIRFAVADKPSQFEFRLWSVGGEAAPEFQFFGGRLIKQGVGGTLHQSEYLALLVELAAMRLKHEARFPAERGA